MINHEICRREVGKSGKVSVRFSFRFLPVLFVFPAIIFLSFINEGFSQTISQRIEKAYKLFEADSRMKHAIGSLYVIDAATGEVVFDKNSQIGLAGASTQKVITAATAFELLGKEYRYKTEFSVFKNTLYVKGSG